VGDLLAQRDAVLAALIEGLAIHVNDGQGHARVG
jgi:hypothetical protein